jgi:hypothetical protein
MVARVCSALFSSLCSRVVGITVLEEEDDEEGLCGVHVEVILNFRET